MKTTIGHLVPQYNTARMVREYAKRFYVPSIKLSQKLNDSELALAKSLTTWKDQVHAAWPNVVVRGVQLDSPDEVAVGVPVKVSATVQLGGLAPKDVAVELYHGPTNGGHEVDKGTIVRMTVVSQSTDGSWKFAGEIPTGDSGAHAFAVRAVPYNDAMSHPYETSLIRWA
jgi:starch phosphorylase